MAAVLIEYEDTRILEIRDVNTIGIVERDAANLAKEKRRLRSILANCDHMEGTDGVQLNPVREELYGESQEGKH
jgi:hypothetical protein